MKYRMTGRVESVTAERRGVQEINVRVGETLRRAVNYPALTRAVAVGDRVTLNTWAAEMGLGSGGADFVAEVNRGHEADGSDLEEVAEPPGHILKLRYTPLQYPVLAVESPESPYHSSLRDSVSLDSAPVICLELHSQMAAAAAAAKRAMGGSGRVVYVMTDSAALPIAWSRLVPALREKGLLDATVTCGQAFGGDFEAVNLYSALAAARVAAQGDVIVVGQGPGSVGTDTALGFSGVDQGMALNAAASLEGTPIAALRLSFADPRARHLGLSHHTRTTLERIALCRAIVPVPILPAAQQAALQSALEEGSLLDRHAFVRMDAEEGLKALEESDLSVTTMGRTLAEERAFFLAAAAAGMLAGQLAAPESAQNRPDAPSATKENR
jgi:hypothetical protein